MNKEDKDKQTPRCTLIAVLVILLLVILGFLVMKDTGFEKTGGKWEATGGCACLPPK